MSDSRFWPDGDEPPPELRELLAFAEAPRPLDGASRQRSRGRVLALAALPAAAGTLFWVQHFALGALLGGAVSVGVAASNGMFSSNEPAKPAVSAMTRPRSASVPAPKAPVPAPVLAEPPPAEDPRSRMPAPAATTPAPSSSTDDGVAREVRLLESARRALAAEPERALAAIERHEREFPAGALAVEREFLAIDALVRSGRRDEAEARAKRLRERTPGSLYEERLGRILGKDE